jgi:hypothetical protein
LSNGIGDVRATYTFSDSLWLSDLAEVLRSNETRKKDQSVRNDPFKTDRLIRADL